MKILHAAKFYAPVRGGMETVLADLCDGTADDWAVQVAVFLGSDYAASHPVS